MKVVGKQGDSPSRGGVMQAVLEVSLRPQKSNAFLSLHPGVLADNPGANLASACGTTMQGSMLGRSGLGLGVPC